MKKIHKIFVTLGLCIGLFFGAEQRECEATGYPTIDISNLLQNILAYLQDADMSGLFSEISDLDMKLEKYHEWKDQFSKFLQTYQMIQKGAKYGPEIVKITVYFEHELEFFLKSVQWFSANGASPAIAQAALYSYNDFKDFYKAMLEDSETKTAFIESFKSGDAIQILEATDNMLKEYQREFYETDVHFRSQISRLYNRHKRMQYALENGRFLRQRVFY